MAQRRNLGIPIFEAVGEADADGIYTLEETGSRRRSRHERVRDAQERERAEKQQREKAYWSSPAGQRERYERDRMAADDAVRAAALAGDPVAMLRENSRQAALDLVSGLRRSGITQEGATRELQHRKLTEWQKAYVMTMVFSCVSPMRRGMNAETLLETVGMGTAMWLCSPNFRQEVGNRLGAVHGAIMNRLARRGEDKLRAHEQKLLDRGGSRADMDVKSLRRLEKIERLDRHGLEPLTPRAAALMEVGIAENAYLEMRAPGADPEKVALSHKQALSELYAMAERDGIDADEISSAMRTIVAFRAQSETRLGRMFQGLAHGSFELIPGQAGFCDITNGKLVDRGSFLVRPPMTLHEHESEMRSVFTAELSRILAENPAKMDSCMYELAMGVHVGEFPEVLNAGGERGQSANPTSRRRLVRSSRMFAAMADDGVPADQAAMAYSRTFVESINAVAERVPEFGAMWDGAEGDLWRQGLSAEMESFRDAAERARSAGEDSREAAAEGEGVSYDPRTMRQGNREDVIDAEIVEDVPSRDETSYDSESHVFIGRRGDPGSTLDAEPATRSWTFSVSEVDGVSMELESVPLPVPGAFGIPRYREGSRESQLFEAMARYMGNDLAQTAHLDDGRDLAGNSRLARSVYGRQLMPGLSRADDAAAEREHSMDSMRLEMQRLGMPAAQQDLMFAASYVRGLEKAVLADPAFEGVLRATQASTTAPAWQEVEFARTAAQLHVGTAGLSYRAYVTKHGMDPDVLHQVAATEPVNFGQVHQSQALFKDAKPQSTANLSETGSETIEETRQRRWRQGFLRGWINREYNAEGGGVSILDPETDAHFSLTD